MLPMKICCTLLACRGQPELDDRLKLRWGRAGDRARHIIGILTKVGCMIALRVGIMG